MYNLGNALEKCCKSQYPLYRYRLLVSADKEKIISVYYRYRPIRKFNLSVIIGIGRYEKMLIDRTLKKCDWFITKLLVLLHFFLKQNLLNIKD